MDSGNIKCVVSNKNGTDECSAKLIAVCKLRTNYSIVRSDHTVNGAWLHTSHDAIFSILTSSTECLLEFQSNSFYYNL